MPTHKGIASTDVSKRSGQKCLHCNTEMLSLARERERERERGRERERERECQCVCV